MWRLENLPKELATFSVTFWFSFLFWLVLFLIVFNCVTTLHILQTTNYYDHFLEHIKIKILSSSTVFYVFPYCWLHIESNDLIFRHNAREFFRNMFSSGLDDIDFFQSSLSELGGCRPACYLQPLAAALGSCYLTVTTSHLVICHSDQVMHFRQ